jgi:hypothetical protein
MDHRTNALWYCIQWESNDTAAFLDDVIEAISDGFLVEGDVLVLDNATIHTGK